MTLLAIPHPMAPVPADPFTDLLPLIVARIKLDPVSDHGPPHWQTVLRNGLFPCQHHPADPEVEMSNSLW